MAPCWKAGWIKAALVFLATLPLVAAVTDPRVSAFDPPDELGSHRYWASYKPPETAPSKRKGASSALIENNTKVLVAGGVDAKQLYDTLHLYDIASGSWEELNLTMSVPRTSFHMASFNNEIVQDLVVVMSKYESSYEVLDTKARTFLHPTYSGIESPTVNDGGCTTWKDLFIAFDGVISPRILLLNVTSWTWSNPELTGVALPFEAYFVNLVVVPNWKGSDTLFIYANCNPYAYPNYLPSDNNCGVFAVDLATWKVTRHMTPTPGPYASEASSTSLVSTDPLGNRYFYRFAGSMWIDNSPPLLASDLSVLRFEPELEWVSVPVRSNPQIQMPVGQNTILIGGLPQNMPAWIGEEPLVHMLGMGGVGLDGVDFVTIERRLTFGGISPIDSIINPPTVNGSLVSDFFEVYAGDTIQLTVDAKNALGAPLPYGLDDVIGFMRHMDGFERTCATNENVNGENMQYIINCGVRVHGNYTLKVQIRGFPPIVPKYQFFVQPARMSIANAIADGSGMQQSNAGQVAMYTVKLYDAYGNRASVVSDQDDVRVSAFVGCHGNVSLAEAELLDASSFEQVEAVVTLTDPGSSLYTIEYIPETTGVCRVQNMVNDIPFGNVTFVVVGDPLPPPGFIAVGSGEGATFLVLNILSCLATCAASYRFGIKAKDGYRDGLILSSGALALVGSLLYIGEPLDASCKARSAIAMLAVGTLIGVMLSQALWYLGYYRTPILSKQLPIYPKRALKYACAAVCCEGLLILILQTTAPIGRSIVTVNGKAYIGCSDATGNSVLYAHLALLLFLCVISFLTQAHRAPDVATSINSVIAYNLTLLALLLIGLIAILRDEDMQIFFVLQSLDIWIACMLIFGLVIYSKLYAEKNTKKMDNLIDGSGQAKTLMVKSTTFESNHSGRGKNQMMVLAQVHVRQDDLMQTTWRKCIYFHSNELPYGVIYYDYSKPGTSLENIEDLTNFDNDKTNLRYGLRLKVRQEEKILAFAKESDRDEYLEALNKIRVRKASLNVQSK